MLDFFLPSWFAHFFPVFFIPDLIYPSRGGAHLAKIFTFWQNLSRYASISLHLDYTHVFIHKLRNALTWTVRGRSTAEGTCWSPWGLNPHGHRQAIGSRKNSLETKFENNWTIPIFYLGIKSCLSRTLRCLIIRGKYSSVSNKRPPLIKFSMTDFTIPPPSRNY